MNVSRPGDKVAALLALNAIGFQDMSEFGTWLSDPGLLLALSISGPVLRAKEQEHDNSR